MEKFFPEVGSKLYLSQASGSYYICAVKRPYTVIGTDKSHVYVQEAKCIFPTPCYYDTMPTSIEADPNGQVLALNWAPKKKRWQIDKYKTGYPLVAHFTQEYIFYPYLD